MCCGTNNYYYTCIYTKPHNITLILIGFVTGSCRNSLNAIPTTHFSPTAQLIALCSAMFSFMCVSTAGLRERLPADATLVGLLPRVGQLVFLEARHLRKTFRAAFKLARVRPFARVSPYVIFQISGSCEGLTAVRVRTHKGPFPSMDPPMNVEVLWSVKPFSTAGKLALARSIRNMDLLDVRSQVCREGERPLASRMVTLVWLVLLTLGISLSH